MKLHHILITAFVLTTVSAASGAGTRLTLTKSSVARHHSESVACVRATEFAETMLVAQCREANGRLTIVEGGDCECASHGEFTCQATAHGYCDR